MRSEKFEVIFHSGKSEIVYAFTEQEARILAQAEQIKKGNDYKIHSSKLLDR